MAAPDENTRRLGSNVILLPEYEALKRGVEKLRTEISLLVLERDQLRFVECRNLETAYMLAVGALEYKAYEAQCLTLRLKRKIEMIQAKRNRQEKVILSQIEHALDAEFDEYQRKLNDQMEKMNQAIERSHSPFLTDEETAECKKLYRAIVKALHPDLHLDLTDAQKQLFQNAVQAYQDGDLNTLRLIRAMSEEPPLPDNRENAAAALYREKERLKNMLTAIHEDIAAIKSEFPYTMKKFLSDPQQVEKKKQELTSIIGQYQDMAKHYQEKIAEMVG